MSDGWIKLHRQIRGHWTFKEPRRFSRFEAWIDLLLTASHAPQKFMLGTTLLTIERGQLATSQMALAQRWRWNRKTVKSFLSVLQRDEMLHIQSSTRLDKGYTVISIRNYSRYQDSGNSQLDNGTDKEVDNEGTGERTTEGQRNGHIQELKNEKKEDNGAKAPRPTNPEVKEFITFFSTEYQKRRGAPYHVKSGKDGKLAKGLLQTFGLPELKTRAIRLLESDDSWISDTDRGIGILASQINKLAEDSSERRKEPKFVNA